MSLKQKKLFKFVSDQITKLEEEERKKLDNSLEQMLKKQQEMNKALLAAVFDGKDPEEQKREAKKVKLYLSISEKKYQSEFLLIFNCFCRDSQFLIRNPQGSD